MGDEEVFEEAGVEEEAAAGAPVEGAEFVPEEATKPRSDVYSLMLILSFMAFVAGIIIVGYELWEFYDVQFYMFNKEEVQPQ